MLLLVDDHQAKILEIDSFAKQRMSANGDIDGAIGNARLGLFQVCARYHA